MVDFTPVSKLYEDKLKILNREQEKQIQRLERKKKKAITKINKEFLGHEEQIGSRYKKDKEKLQKEYYGIACGVVMKQLDEDYSVLQDRSVLLDLDLDILSKVTDIANSLSGIPDDETRDQARNTVEIALDEKGKETLDFIMNKNSEARDITSYVANSRNECCLLVPIDEDQNKDLAHSLENKIMSILDMQKISFGAVVDVHSSGVVAGSNTHEIKFKQDVSSYNGFLVYTIEPTDPRYSQELLKALTEKLEELQPEGFEKVRIVHKVKSLDYGIIDYFMTHSREKMYNSENEILELRSQGIELLSVEDAARISQKSKKAIRQLITLGKLKADENKEISISSLEEYLLSKSKRKGKFERKSRHVELKFGSKDPEKIREEAIKRLGEFTEKLTIKDFAYVLGISNNGAAAYIARGDVDSTKEYTGRKSVHLVKKERIRKIIDTYKPFSLRGWMKPK